MEKEKKKKAIPCHECWFYKTNTCKNSIDNDRAETYICTAFRKSAPKTKED